jgi:site-specific DNA-methyltransferase (adenine-specific)
MAIFKRNDGRIRPKRRNNISRKPQGQIEKKKYLDEAKGSLLGNVWTDITNVQGTSKERIGYPTQKPEALLERIIKMASNEGDIVLDPFMGGGTTIAVADRLNRQWIGIDQSAMAVKVTELRLQKLAESNTPGKAGGLNS